MLNRPPRRPSLRYLAIFFVAIGWLAAPGWPLRPASAHEVPFSYLDLRPGDRAIGVTLTIHSAELAPLLGVEPARLLDDAALALRRDRIQDLIRERLRLEVDGQWLDPRIASLHALAEQQAVRLSLEYDAASAGRIGLDCRLFPEDPRHQTFLNVYEPEPGGQPGETLRQQQILSAGKTRFEYFTGTRQGVVEVLRRFVPGGIEHIFIGPDHILFLVGLLLTGGRLRRLLLIVTAFTLAHSATLTLAATGLVDIPPQIVEPAIALSIIYIGVDNLLAERGGRDLRPWIAFLFGLIHGFGFAGVLREFGLPAEALGWSLFSFNLGVEIGQTLIVVAIASLLVRLKKRRPNLEAPIVKGVSTGIIMTGAYWFVTRIFF